MSIRRSIEGRGYSFGTGIGAFDGAFQRRWKVGCGPGTGQKEIGQWCLRNGPMGTTSSVARKEWADLPNNVGLTEILSMGRGKVEEILDEGPGCMKEPFLIVFQSDRLTECDTGDHGLWRIGFFAGLTDDPVKRI